MESGCTNQFEHLFEFRGVFFESRLDDDVICSALAEQAPVRFYRTGCSRDIGARISSCLIVIYRLR